MNKREQHKNATAAAIVAIARYGYLRASDLAELIYSGKAAGLRMAQRLTAKLVEDGQLLRAQENRCEEAHFALTEAGAREAHRLTGEHYKSGKDLLRTITGHRDGANRVCARAQAAGKEVMTDREICCRADREFLGKVPDALIIEREEDECGGERVGYVWVEVENCYRSKTDLDKLARFVLEVFKRELMCTAYRHGWIDEVRLVVSDEVAAGIAKRLQKRIDELAGEGAGARLMKRAVMVEML